MIYYYETDYLLGCGIMKKVVSAGGVVFLNNSILLLRKLNGDWVLPKGKLRKNEFAEDAAIREVYEETSIKVTVIDYLGTSSYTFRNCWSNNEVVDKNVHWFLMNARNSNTRPQKEEGFVDSKFIPIYKAVDTATYDDEKRIIEKAIEKNGEI